MKIILSNTSRKAFLALFDQIKLTANEQNIVIAPDRFAVSVSRAIVSMLDCPVTSNIEVIPFSKLGERFIKKEVKKCLSSNGTVMLLSKVLIRLSNSKQLTHYMNATMKEGFAHELTKTITSFRNSGINPEDLLNANDKLPDNLKSKNKDLYLIYKTYLEELTKYYEDSSSVLEKLAVHFEKDASDISGINFYVTDIYDFNVNELEILRVLANKALSLTIALPYGFDNPNKSIYPNWTLDRLNSLLDGGKPEIVEAIDDLSKDKDVINKYLFSYRAPKEKVEKPNNIILRRAADKYDEVLQLAVDINEEIRNGGRYKDFEVYVGNINEYEGEIKSIFSRYHIPFFIDEKADFIQQAKTRFILSAIKCVKNGFALQDVLDFVKNPLFYGSGDEINQDAINAFENYVIKYNIDRSIFLNEFTINDEKCKYTAPYDIIVFSENNTLKVKYKEFDENTIPEKVRKRFVHLINGLYKIKNDTDEPHTIKEYCEKCIDIIKDEKTEKAWQNHVKALANISNYYKKCSEQVDKKLNDIFEEMNDVLDTVSSFNNFYIIFKSLVETMKIALVPTTIDGVFIGSSESGFMGDKHIYILGATNSSLPTVPSDTSILTEKEKDILNLRASIQIIPSRRQQLYMNMYKVCDIMKKPLGNLVISYPSNDSAGETKPSNIYYDLNSFFDGIKVENISFDNIMKENKSSIVKKVSNMFTTKEACLHEVIRNSIAERIGNTEKQLYNTVETFVKDDAQRIREQLDEPEYINIENNIGISDKTSVSKIETFYSCPYEYYFKYMLGLKERDESKFKGTENGTIIHFVLDKFLSNREKDSNLTEDEIKELACKYFDQAIEENGFTRFLNNADTGRLLLRVKEECKSILVKIDTIAKRSKFIPCMLEAKIGDDEDSKIAPLTLENGDIKVDLTGYIDRVDANEDKFIVIDYKTYKSADYDLKDLYRGKKVQPLIYMRAVENDKKLVPVGVFYLPITADFTSKDENTLVLKGLASSDEEILKEIDPNLGDNDAFVSIRLERGKMNLNKHLTNEQFDILGDYAEKISTKGVNYIKDGFIKPTPLSGSCEFCNYNDICEFKLKNERKNNTISISAFDSKQND